MAQETGLIVSIDQWVLHEANDEGRIMGFHEKKADAPTECR